MYRKQKQNKTTKEQNTTPVQTLYFVLLFFCLVFDFYLFTSMFEVVLYFVLCLFCSVFVFCTFISMFELVLYFVLLLLTKEQSTTPLQTLK
jgi:hypothetical protein